MSSPAVANPHASARAFTRSLNILLKYVRLYGFEHARSAAQRDTAWCELQLALAQAGNSGLLLGTSAGRLVIDGVPVESTPTEQAFAQLLANAEIATLHFRTEVRQDEFLAFVRGFASGGSRGAKLAEELKGVLSGIASITMNALKFVAQDAAAPASTAAAQIAAAALGDKAHELHDLLSDPAKLLQAIAAASSASSVSREAEPQPSGALAEVIPFPSSPGNENSEPAGERAQADFAAVMRMLTRVSMAGTQPDIALGPHLIASETNALSGNAQQMLQAALLQSASLPNHRPDTPMLLQLAEQLAIRFALERFERGEVRVNAVREMLERMGKDLENLRTVLKAHESAMERAGLHCEKHADILDRQFWAALPASAKKSILLSPEAWCIPPRNIRVFVEELLAKGEPDIAGHILINYAQCVRTKDTEGRRKAATGLSELADVYGRSGSLLEVAIYQLAEQLACERDPDMQTLFTASFTRLSQEASSLRRYAGVQQTLRSLEMLDGALPGLAEVLRPRVGVYERLPEFIREALSSPQLPNDLQEVLQRMAGPASLALVNEFDRCTRRSQCERAVALAKTMGDDALSFLLTRLQEAPPQDAVLAVGLMSRLDRNATDAILSDRIHHWSRAQQAHAVQQIAAASPANASGLYLCLLDRVHQLVVPEVIDELGMTGDREAASYPLQQLAFNDAQLDAHLLRVKAVEALGRLRDPDCADGLRHLVAERSVMGWRFPRELRIAAAQALRLIEPDIAPQFLADKGLSNEDLAGGALDAVRESPYIRQRKYPRLQFAAGLDATVITSRNRCHIAVRSLSIGGGAGAAENRFAPGTHAAVELQAGIRKARAQVLLKELPTRELGFEIVGMDLDERGKLRKILSGGDFATNLFRSPKAFAARSAS